MKNVNWLAECAIVSGEFPFAISRLESVIASVSDGTRVWLEAVALLAICYIRKEQYSEARGYHLQRT